MQNKIGILMIASIGTMFYCSDFLIRKSSRTSQEMLFRHVEILLRKTVCLAQKVSEVQAVILQLLPLIVEGSLAQGVRKELVHSMTHLQNKLNICEGELDTFLSFVNKRVLVPCTQEKNNTK